MVIILIKTFGRATHPPSPTFDVFVIILYSLIKLNVQLNHKKRTYINFVIRFFTQTVKNTNNVKIKVFKLTTP